jgi:His/Glu/Gln/Arg/opine family amino acid ABC transporter permease subunit
MRLAVHLLADWQFDRVWDDHDLLFKGLRKTLWLSTLAMALALVGGLPVALARMSRIKPLSWLASIYINVIRGIPLLILIIYVYFGLSIWLGVNFSAFTAGIISLTVLHTAWMAEIYRAGLQAVPKGQREAAASLGMGRTRAFFSITLPQAIRLVIPTAGNDFVGMVKDTSLVGIIGIFELYRTGQRLVSETFLPFEVWTIVAAMYVAVVFVIDQLVRFLERALAPVKKRGPLEARRQAQIDALTQRVRLGANKDPFLDLPQLKGGSA